MKNNIINLNKYLKQNNLARGNDSFLYNKPKFILSYHLVFIYIINPFILYSSVRLVVIVVLLVCVVFICSVMSPDAVIKIIDKDHILISNKNGISKVDSFEIKKLFLVYYKVKINGETYYAVYGNIKKLKKINE